MTENNVSKMSQMAGSSPALWGKPVSILPVTPDPRTSGHGIATGQTREVDAAVLQYLLRAAKIEDIDEARGAVEDMINKEILEQHLEKYKVWQGDGKDKRFKSYVPVKTEDGQDRRRLIVAPDREKLEKKIVQAYRTEQKKQKKNLRASAPTLASLFQEWLDFKALHTQATTYIKRIDGDWRRYYEGTPIATMPISEMTEIALDAWAHWMVQERSLTKKQYFNMTVIIRQELEYARRQGHIDSNPFENVKVDGRLFRKEKKKADETQVFLTDEQPEIVNMAFKDYEDSGDVLALGVPLMFQLGVRAGEMVALMFGDINERKQNYVHVQRMLVRVERRLPDGTWGKADHQIVEHVKTSAGDRDIYLTSEALRIIEMIREYDIEHGFGTDGFLFQRRDRCVTERMIDCKLRKYCRWLGMPEKSQHKIRKTYISSLIDSGEVNINVIRAMVGHEDERTTYRNYCYNRRPEIETQEGIEKALSAAYR